MKKAAIAFVVSCALLLTASCAHVQHPAYKIATPAQLCRDERLVSFSFCMPAQRIETLLRQGSMNILDAPKSASGTTSPKRMVLEFPSEGLVIRAKWKKAHRHASGLNNNPRKELAAATLQKLFLDEDEYVVPPTVGRCLPLDRYRPVAGSATATFEETSCVFGVLAYWVENAEYLGPLDKPRFEASPAYRATVGNMNLLTYLIAHGDTRPSNFVISKDRERPRAFAVDNGLAFGGLTNPRTLIHGEWRKLLVPEVSRAKIERLRRITRTELDTLAVVAQFEIRGGEMLPVPPTAPINLTKGVRRQGDVIQLGLTRPEIDGVERRLTALLKDTDSGKIKVF